MLKTVEIKYRQCACSVKFDRSVCACIDAGQMGGQTRVMVGFILGWLQKSR